MTEATQHAKAEVFDQRICELGEGPLWHPARQQLFWFDILGRRLLTVEHGVPRHWQFDEHVSAAGWIDDNALLIASESRIFRFDLETGKSETVAPLEADEPRTRSNDGRADPWGGFWIGTMGKSAEAGLGAIYRYHGGELRKLHGDITIPNAICFDDRKAVAYFTDTLTRVVRRQALDPATGWPTGPAEPWLDLSAAGLVADGAVTDTAGNVWIAHWGAGCVTAYSPDAAAFLTVDMAAPHASCPAFGGDNFTTLFCTTATELMDAAMLAANPKSGMTFCIEDVGKGGPEPQVIP